MKVIIAGSRGITDVRLVARAIEASGFEVTEVVSGGAAGVDRLGERWAARRGIPVRRFLPDWSQGKAAGPLRNRRMAAYADALVALWDGASRGTASMIREARTRGIKMHVDVVGRTP